VTRSESPATSGEARCSTGRWPRLPRPTPTRMTGTTRRSLRRSKLAESPHRPASRPKCPNGLGSLADDPASVRTSLLRGLRPHHDARSVARLDRLPLGRSSRQLDLLILLERQSLDDDDEPLHAPDFQSGRQSRPHPDWVKPKPVMDDVTIRARRSSPLGDACRSGESIMSGYAAVARLDLGTLRARCMGGNVLRVSPHRHREALTAASTGVGS
jgi:hypothetical protein